MWYLKYGMAILHLKVSANKYIQKPKVCVECGRDDLPHFSKKRCIYCASKYYNEKYTLNSRRKKEDKSEKPINNFYSYHVSNLNNLKDEDRICENCGGKIRKYALYSNVAHILPKSRYISIGEDLNNYLYLCTDKDETGNNCHYDFDFRGREIRESMPVFSIAKSRYLEFLQNKVAEQGNLRNELEFN